MKHKIIIDTGDSTTLIIPNRKVPLLRNFDLTKPLGEVEVFVEDGQLVGLVDDVALDNLSYSIGVKVEQVTKYKLLCVSII